MSDFLLNESFVLKDEICYEVGDFFKILGDSTRIKILYLLLKEELNVTDITDRLGMNQSAVSHQLRVLRQNGMVKNRKNGKEVIYSLDDHHVHSLLSQGIEHILHRSNIS